MDEKLQPTPEESTENDNEKEEISAIRVWIRRFFTPECISAFFLSVMSIIISVVGLKSDATSRNIAATELDILINDREAYFTVEMAEDFPAVQEDGYEGFIVPYTIHNEGGRISGTRVSASSYIEFLVSHNKPAEYSEDGTLITPTEHFLEVYYIPLNELASINGKSYKAYNEETKSFAVDIKYPYNFFDFLDLAESKLNNKSDFISTSSVRRDEVKIEYCNFENTYKSVNYELGTDYMSVKTDNIWEKYSEIDAKVVRVNFDFTDFSDAEAATLADMIYQRFAESLATSNVDDAEIPQ